MKAIRYLIVILTFLSVYSAEAATKTWTGTTNSDWNTGSNWGGTAPVSGDVANIPGGLSNYPIINGAVTINTVNINTSGSGASITVTTGGTFTVTSLLTVNANGTFTVNGGTVSLSGITSSGAVVVSGGTITSNAHITLNSGATFSQSGGLIHLATNTSTLPTENLIIASGATLTQSGGTIYIKDYTSSAGTFNQTGSGALFKIYRDWKPGAGSVFNSTAGIVQFTGNGGPDFAAGTRQFTNIIVDAGVDPGFGNASSSTLLISGDFTNNNTTLSTSNNATFTFNGTGNQTITSLSTISAFGHISINKASGNIIMASDMGLSGNWNNITNTALTGGSYTVRFTGTGTISGTTSFPKISLAPTATNYNLANNNSCTSLTLEAASSNISFSQNNGVNLSVSGNVTINQPTSGAVIAWNINGGSATVGGNVVLLGSATNSNRIVKVAITTGTLTITGDLVYNMVSGSEAAMAVVDMSGGSGTMNINGNMTLSGAAVGTLAPGTTSTVVYNGTANQTITYQSAINYNHLKIEKISGTASLMAHTIISGDMILQQGTVAATGSNYNLTVGGSWANNGGAYTGGTSTVTFAGTTGTIGGTTSTSFPNLAIGGASATAYTMNNDNSCISLTFNTGGNNSSLTHAGAAHLSVSGAVTINQPTASSRSNDWNINTGSATVSGLISFSGSNTTTSRVGKIVITSGTLNANAGMSFTGSANATKVIDMSGGAGVLNLKGALTVPANSGTLTAGSSGSIFNYADDINAQTINFFPAGAYNTLRSNNTSVSGATLGAAITTSNVTNNFRILSGTFSNGGFAITLNASKVFEVGNGATFRMTGTSGMVTGTTITKTFGATSTCDYAGTAQTVSAETYGHLILSSSGVKTMPATTTTVQGNFTTSGTISATAAASINVNGNVTLGSGTTFGGGSFTHNIQGNWTHNGATFTSGTSTISFTGSVAQTLGGSASTAFNNLTINNNAGISFSRSQTVAGVLTFTNGLITTTSSNLLILNAGASSTGAGTGKFVHGPIRKIGNSSFTFPVGKSSVYAPLTISAPAVATDAFTTEYIRASGTALGSVTASGLVRVSNCEYWQLDRTTGTSNVNVTLSWSGSSNCNAATYINDLASLTIAHFDGTNWNSQGRDGGTTGNASAGTITWNNVSDYSPFTFGGKEFGSNPLPLKFGDFKVYVKQNGVQLDWTTLTENNMSHFEIQRSTNGSNFATIGQVNARNLNSKSAYSWFDAAPLADNNYYRIKAVDIDAKYDYTAIVRISFGKTMSGINLYPNPVKDKRLTFETGSMVSGQYKLAVYDFNGKTIYYQHFNHQGGSVSQSIQLPAGINSGIYHLQISGFNFNSKRTFVVF